MSCHCPHTADSLECLPQQPNKNNKLPSKTQTSEMRKSAAAVRPGLRVTFYEYIEGQSKTAGPDIRDLFFQSPTTPDGKFAGIASDSSRDIQR